MRGLIFLLLCSSAVTYAHVTAPRVSHSALLHERSLAKMTIRTSLAERLAQTLAEYEAELEADVGRRPVVIGLVAGTIGSFCGAKLLGNVGAKGYAAMERAPANTEERDESAILEKELQLKEARLKALNAEIAETEHSTLRRSSPQQPK